MPVDVSRLFYGTVPFVPRTFCPVHGEFRSDQVGTSRMSRGLAPLTVPGTYISEAYRPPNSFVCSLFIGFTVIPNKGAFRCSGVGVGGGAKTWPPTSASMGDDALPQCTTSGQLLCSGLDLGHAGTGSLCCRADCFWPWDATERQESYYPSDNLANPARLLEQGFRASGPK